MPNVSVKRAIELYRKAHKGLTAREEADAHKGEELLKKKGIVAKRITKSKGKDKFTFTRKKTSKKPKNNKKKIDEALLKRPTYPGSGELSASGGTVIHEPAEMSNIDWARHAARSLKRRIVDLIKGRNNKNKPQQQPQEEDVPF